MLASIDYIIIVAYLIGVAAFGIIAGGKQKNTSDYFLGSRELPWWAVCFSVIATETSTLTVIGIPAVSYGGTLAFFQITFGYIIGRTLVAMYFLPKYYKGQISTAYEYLGQRFGPGMRKAASSTFIVTRLLADGVRLFATAIPLKIIASMAGFEFSYFEIIAIIGFITIIYTYIGGIKAVVWMDVVQMGVYIGGALWAIYALSESGGLFESKLASSGKLDIFVSGFEGSFSEWIVQPYTIITATIGGAIFSMASHGTDQIIVQRLLTCRNLADSRKALIGSGIGVMIQFAIFLVIGLLLWLHYDGASINTLGLTRGDEVFPKFIVEGLPAGVSGILLAGIIAAAMSTLSSSLNSLSAATVLDLLPQKTRERLDSEGKSLSVAKRATLFWGLVFIVFATLFEDQKNPVVELGLAIASFTYGGLLGAFLLSLRDRRPNEKGAIAAFLSTVIVMVIIIFGVWYSSSTETWIFDFYPSATEKSAQGLKGIAWPWYTAIGSALCLAFGWLASKIGGEVEE